MKTFREYLTEATFSTQEFIPQTIKLLVEATVEATSQNEAFDHASNMLWDWASRNPDDAVSIESINRADR